MQTLFPYICSCTLRSTMSSAYQLPISATVLAGLASSSTVSHASLRSLVLLGGTTLWAETGLSRTRSFTRPGTSNVRNSWRFLATACEDNVSSFQDNPRPWTSRIGETVVGFARKGPLQVVLVSPQIPGNTGSIARTCAATSVGLHLVEPLGFQIDDTKLKRAGLDYWPFVVVKVHQSWSEFMRYFRQQEGEKRLLAFTKRGSCLYTEISYRPGDWLVFGSETSGLPEAALKDCADEDSYGGGKVRIPIVDTYVRSLNLSVAAGIGLYEALRQLNLLEDLCIQSSDYPTDDSLMESAEV